MKKLTVKAKTVEEAIVSGLQQLNLPRERVNVEVLEQPSRGLFGLIGSRNATVELEVIPDPVEEAIAFLYEVTEAMDIGEVSIERKKTRDGIELHLFGGDMGIVIGRRGQTLESLQYLVNIVANRYASSHVRIVLDAEHFRDRRKKTLAELAVRLAEKAIRTRKEVELEPMSSQDRKVIHATLQQRSDVETFSRGEEPYRKVVIVSR